MSYSVHRTLLHVLSLVLRSMIVAWVRYCMMNFTGLTGILQACSDSSSVSEPLCTTVPDGLLHPSLSVLPTVIYLQYHICSSTLMADGLVQLPAYGLCWILSGTRRSLQIVSDKYSKNICSHDTSASSTLKNSRQ